MRRLIFHTLFLLLCTSPLLAHVACEHAEKHKLIGENPERASRILERRRYLIDLHKTTRRNATMLISQGKCDEAVDLYKESISELTDLDYEDNPCQPGGFYTDLAIDASQCGNEKEAISAFLKAIEIHRECSQFSVASVDSFLLAHLYQRTNDLESAEKYFLQAVALAERIPTEPGEEGCAREMKINAMIDLHAIYIKQGRMADAEKLASEIAELSVCFPSDEKKIEKFLKKSTPEKFG